MTTLWEKYYSGLAEDTAWVEAHKFDDQECVDANGRKMINRYEDGIWKSYPLVAEPVADPHEFDDQEWTDAEGRKGIKKYQDGVWKSYHLPQANHFSKILEILEYK